MDEEQIACTGQIAGIGGRDKLRHIFFALGKLRWAFHSLDGIPVLSHNRANENRLGKRARLWPAVRREGSFDVKLEDTSITESKPKPTRTILPARIPTEIP